MLKRSTTLLLQLAVVVDVVIGVVREVLDEEDKENRATAAVVLDVEVIPLSALYESRSANI